MGAIMTTKAYTTAQAEYAAHAVGLPDDQDMIEQLRVGMGVEHEHDDLIGGNAIKSATIAAAHLREDPLYYLWLVALERFRDGKKPAQRVQVSVAQVKEGPCIVLGIEGIPTPIWGDVLPEVQAKAVALFLRQRPALAIVYAWMCLIRD